jgi:hypothetical protein
MMGLEATLPESILPEQFILYETAHNDASGSPEENSSRRMRYIRNSLKLKIILTRYNDQAKHIILPTAILMKERLLYSGSEIVLNQKSAPLDWLKPTL